MNPLNDYIIQFTGLSDGLHAFKYNIDHSFFTGFEMSEIREGNVKIELTFDKQATMFVLEFDIIGYVVCECDLCLNDYQQEIAGNARLIVKFNEDKSEESDEIRVLSPSAHQLDISQDIYEFINLILPVKRVHPVDAKGNSGCDPEMIRKLEKLSIKENNSPIWDELNKISFKN